MAGPAKPQKKFPTTRTASYQPMRSCTQPNPTMPIPSNPATPTPQPPPPPRMRRLRRAGWVIKSLATLFVFAFLIAYANIDSRYGTPHTQARTSPTHPSFLSAVFHPSQSTHPTRTNHLHRHPTFLRVNRRVPRRIHRTSFYHLASLHRLHRLFNEILDVRS